MILHIPGPAGRLEALVDDPAALCTTGRPVLADLTPPLPPRAAVVIGHPHPLHGGTMHTRVIFQAAKAFCRLGCAVLRFNFRGVGLSEGRFDNGRGERADFCFGIDFMSRRFPGVEIWAAGMSFGAWVALTEGAADPRVTLLVGIALPTTLYDFSTVAASPKPKYFIHGERDELCPIRSVWELYGRSAEPKELVVVDAANHLFDGRVGEVADAIVDLIGPPPDSPGREGVR